MHRTTAALITTLALMLAVSGCVSTNAQLTRQEFALESEMRNRDNASVQRSRALGREDQLVQLEIERLQQQLDRQNQRAGANVERVAQNYVDYYGALEELRRRVAAEHEKIASLHEEQIVLGRGYRLLSDMADVEFRVSRELSAQAISEARRSAEELWRQYQIANPPRLPDPQPAPPVQVVE